VEQLSFALFQFRWVDRLDVCEAVASEMLRQPDQLLAKIRLTSSTQLDWLLWNLMLLLGADADPAKVLGELAGQRLDAASPEERKTGGWSGVAGTLLLIGCDLPEGLFDLVGPDTVIQELRTVQSLNEGLAKQARLIRLASAAAHFCRDNVELVEQLKAELEIMEFVLPIPRLTKAREVLLQKLVGAENI
jgi:hypothetical protein